MIRVRNILVGVGAVLWLASALVRAETVVWSDNFDTNAASRWSLGGSWHITSPTAGPGPNGSGYRTYSGPYCANTQNYGSDVDGRMICTNYNGARWFSVPTADQFPRLRYWHWFNLINSLGYVEVTTDGTNWTAISPNYSDYVSLAANSGGVWSRPSIDLSGYAGQNIQIALHFYGGATPNKLGWFVDDIAVVTGAPVMYSPESFERGQGDWSVDQGTWQIGQPTGGPGAAHLGVNCAGTILGGNYPNNIQSRLISPIFVVPSNSPTLHFWQWYSFASSGLGFVEITTGTNWTAISSNYLFGSSGGWTNVSLDLTAYAGQPVELAFHFAAGGLATAAGWYIDDISIGYGPSLIVPDAQTVFAGQTFTVTNYATNALAPGALYTFQLTAPSTNYWITTNGVLTWTNTGIHNGVLVWTNNSVAPGTQTITVKVTDNSTPPQSTTNSFQATFEPPPPPALTVPDTQTIAMGQTLVVTNFALSTNLPQSLFTFSLAAASTNAWLTTNGVLWWTNTLAAPGTNLMFVKVKDNSVPALLATNSFAVIVSPPPVILAPPTQFLHSGQTLAVPILATNPFLPASQFAFSLPAPSTNYWITTNGLLTWTNTGIQGNSLVWTNNSVAPGTNVIYVNVRDNTSPGMSAGANFNLVILPPLPPVLTVPASQNIYAGQTLVLTNTATNSGLPNSTFTFAAAGPTNLDLSTLPTNGVWRWSPTTGQATGPYTNIITVTDNSRPPLSASGSFVITVLSPPPPALTVPPTQVIYPGQTMVVTNFATNSILPNSKFTFSVAFGPANLDLSGFAASGVLRWTPTLAQSPSVNQIYIKVTDTNTPPLTAVGNFVVVVSALPSPMLAPGPAAAGNGGFQFLLSTVPDTTWRVDVSTNLISWQPAFTNAADAGGLLWFTDRLSTNFPRRFYRAAYPSP